MPYIAKKTMIKMLDKHDELYKIISKLKKENENLTQDLQKTEKTLRKYLKKIIISKK